MRVSRNELTSMLKQALEGTGLPWGIYDEAAEATVWAEMIGCGVLQSFTSNLEDCAKQNHDQISCTRSAKQLKLTPDCATTLHCLGQIAGMIDANFSDRQRDEFEVIIQPCNSPALLVLALSRLAREHGVLTAAWLEANILESKTNLLIAEFLPHKKFPCVRRFDIKNQAALENKPAANGLCVRTEAFTDKLLTDLPFGFTLDLVENDLFDSEQCAANYQNALDRGIEISLSLWDKLSSLANLVLVESSEQSRRGAGA